MTQNNIIWLLSESTLLLSSTLTYTHGATLSLPLLCQPRACGSLSGTRKNKATGISEKNRTTLLQIHRVNHVGKLGEDRKESIIVT